MKINVIGGGPAGLYFAILMKKLDPAHDITVVERDGPHDTFGWGIVFSEKTLAFLDEHDHETYTALSQASQSWDHVVVVHKGETLQIAGNPISGIARLTFLNILHDRCRALGVDLRFHTNVTNVADYADCDLLVGADGANSLVRRTYEGFFAPSVDIRQNKYIWLGTEQPFHGLTLIFRQSDAGLFIAHAYRFSPTLSTFIVECPPDTWVNAGFERMSGAETCATLAEVFRDDLGGQPLLSNNFVKWFNFALVKNKRWHHTCTGNPGGCPAVVLLGDALHTAHFSIGSGTKLALEDAIALANAFAEQRTLAQALPTFERARRPPVERFQAAALNSLLWLENVHNYLHLDPVPFTYRLLLRSKRVSFNRIRRGDPDFAARYDAWRKAQPQDSPIPADFLDLFQKPSIGHLATLMPDGTPHVTSVYVDYDGRYILVNSAKGRLKDRNMRERPDVALQIPDPDDINRYLLVRGRVVEITEEGADEHLDKLSARYLGRDKYPPSMRYPGEVRVLYRIEPRHVTAWNPFG